MISPLKKNNSNKNISCELYLRLIINLKQVTNKPNKQVSNIHLTRSVNNREVFPP